MANIDFVLQAMNVYVESIGKLGWVESMTPPIPKKKIEKFRGGGMLMEAGHPMGWEMPEFDFDLTAFDPAMIAEVGLFSKNDIPISFTQALDGEANAQHSNSFTCVGTFTYVSGAQKIAGQNVMKCKGTVKAAKLIYDGVIIFDFDIRSNKYVFNGVDEYAWIKSAL